MTVVSVDIPTLVILFFGMTLAGIVSEFGKDLYHSHFKKAAKKAIIRLKVT